MQLSSKILLVVPAGIQLSAAEFGKVVSTGNCIENWSLDKTGVLGMTFTV